MPPSGETLFVGLYEIKGKGIAPAGLVDPLTGEDVGGKHLYEMVKTGALSEFEGRLVVDWGPATQAWVQRAANRDKVIVETRSRIAEPPFPGFRGFCASLSGVFSLMKRWALGTYLRSARVKDL